MRQNRHNLKCVAVYKLKAIKKEITKCDSLKIRHEKQFQRILDNSNSIIRITQEKDSINNIQQRIREESIKISKELTKEKAKKTSLLEKILLVVSAFIIGGLTF